MEKINIKLMPATLSQNLT